MVITGSEPATGLGALAAAGVSERVTHTSTTLKGAPTELTGLVHLPHGKAPKDGWPIVTWGHMTTGGSDSSAPSTAEFDHPEERRMTQGDHFIGELLDRGVAVLRPDYEGIGSPGPHPYLVGPSLARSVTDLLASARSSFPLAERWVSAGHSEGAVAALWAASEQHRPVAEVGALDLRGVCVFTPVTRMDRTIGAALHLPVVLPGFAVVSALIGLMLRGAATTDPELDQLVSNGGLSPAAEGLWPHLDERCLVELSSADSWGGLAPRAILGPNGKRVRELLLNSFRENEVAELEFPRGLPMHVDASIFDEVAPFWLTRRAVRMWSRSGVHLETKWWPTSHSPVLAPQRSPKGAADWVSELLARD